MKVYLAAPYAEMKLMRGWAEKLARAGHICTAKWIRGDEEGVSLNAAAQMDLDDIDEADVVISLTLPKGTMFSSGGRHVEFGYGLAKGKSMIIICADRENVFHHLARVRRFDSIDEAIGYLT